MKKIHHFGDDDDDDDLDRPSPLLQTQRFTKSGTVGTKDLKMTQSRSKHTEVSNLDLNRINEDDSLNDTDDDTNTKTGRSTSSATTSQLTPKPRERSFIRNNAEKPKIQPRRIDIDDDDRSPFGQTTMKSSPRHQILTLREEEERDQSFMKGFQNNKNRQSSPDVFSMDHKSDSRRNNRQFPDNHQHKVHHGSDDENFSNKQTKQNTFQKSRQSTIDSDKSPSGKTSHRIKDDTDQSDNEENFSNKQTKQKTFQKSRQSTTDSDRSPSGKTNHRIKDDTDQSDNEEKFPNKHTKQNTFQKSRQSTIDSDKSPSRKTSHRSQDDINQSDDDENNHLHKPSSRQDYRKQRQPIHDLAQTSPKDTDSHVIQHQPSSSRPGSASKKEVESARRSSYCEDQDTVIPPITKSQSRPTSAKTNTTRQQTQSAIDNVTSANAPFTHDPLTSNNEALAATLRPSSPPPPPPRPSARRPPRPKSSYNTTTGGIDKKPKFKVPSRYKEITSVVDTGRKPVDTVTLTSSIARALDKALKSQTLPRPQSSRARRHSANSNNSERQRRRSSSAYEHVKPRVNTNLSINFDELNTSHMRADSSQSIKDGVYMEWLKAKEGQKKLEKEELKRWQQEKTKQVDKSQLERKIKQDAQNLERWRQEREEQMRKKKEEELALIREQTEKKKREQQQKKKDAEMGFKDWEEKKKEQESKQKVDVEEIKKSEIEKREEEKQKRYLKATTEYQKWVDRKSKQTEKVQEANKTAREDQLKKIRVNEETKFVSAQEAYETWLKEKDKYEMEEKIIQQRRNSLSAKQQQAPFLPGGSQKNTGKVRHVVW